MTLVDAIKQGIGFGVVKPRMAETKEQRLPKVDLSDLL
jgi:hypothetical protein